MRTTVQSLLSDALFLDTKPVSEQERVIAGLTAEIEAANSKLASLTAQGSTASPSDTGDMLQMMTALSRSRQCCPQCQAAQMPMPQMQFSGCSAPPVQNMMRSIVPYQPQALQTQGYGMFDNLSDTMLTMGAKGSEVRRLQGLLKAAGYSVSVDGNFGMGTQKAVEKFQAANALRSDGRMKADDWTKLQEIAGKKTGATARAEAGKNNVPTVREKVAGVSDTLVRVVAPLVIAVGATGATWLITKQSNIPKKAAVCAGSGLAAGVVSYLGLNALADAMTTIPEEEI
jgi:hypothetical protein